MWITLRDGALGIGSALAAVGLTLSDVELCLRIAGAGLGCLVAGLTAAKLLRDLLRRRKNTPWQT